MGGPLGGRPKGHVVQPGKLGRLVFSAPGEHRRGVGAVGRLVLEADTLEVGRKSLFDSLAHPLAAEELQGMKLEMVFHSDLDAEFLRTGFVLGLCNQQASTEIPLTGR